MPDVPEVPDHLPEKCVIVSGLVWVMFELADDVYVPEWVVAAGEDAIKKWVLENFTAGLYIGDTNRRLGLWQVSKSESDISVEMPE